MNTVTGIIIGRDGSTFQLRLTIKKQTMLLGQKGSVPDSVSRKHVRIDLDEDGQMLLTNLDLNNSTYVNGREVEVKRVCFTDVIELGPDHYPLSWEVINTMLPKVADISELRKIWDGYQSQMLNWQIKERRTNALRNITPVFMVVSSLVGILYGREHPWVLGTMIGIIVINFALFVISLFQASDVPKRNKKLRETAESNYKCPCCGCLFPLQSYERLLQMKRCPHCGALLKG